VGSARAWEQIHCQPGESTEKPGFRIRYRSIDTISRSKISCPFRAQRQVSSFSTLCSAAAGAPSGREIFFTPPASA